MKFAVFFDELLHFLLIWMLSSSENSESSFDIVEMVDKVSSTKFEISLFTNEWFITWNSSPNTRLNEQLYNNSNYKRASYTNNEHNPSGYFVKK